ncbi:MAG: DUF4124 domain-containing protein [Pseudomonadota bacterium]
MKLSRPILFLVACTLSMAATAQWQWVDKTGRKVYSDRPPPSDIPEKSILKQPGSGRAMPTAAPAAPAAGASAAAAPASAAVRAAASAPKLTGKDAELEAKKKQAEQEEAAKKKAAEDKVAADRAQNCERAKGNLKMLQSGRRMQQTNAQGEPEIMTDDTRSAETKRAQDIIAQDCGATASR